MDGLKERPGMRRGDEDAQRLKRLSDESRSTFVAHWVDADEEGAQQLKIMKYWKP
jgi:hypothetical protein